MGACWALCRWRRSLPPQGRGTKAPTPAALAGCSGQSSAPAGRLATQEQRPALAGLPLVDEERVRGATQSGGQPLPAAFPLACA